ncbi:MAG: hypothetical protein JRC55_07000 [Deltaproteobacteria bacterium]|nr:hypothetical protein [Deltaproteobacteria bacterium]
MNEQETQLKTQHNFGDFLYWNLVVSVPLVMVIYKFYCTHCPHYIQSPKNTKCMFFWGIPKFFKEKSGPLSLIEKSVALVIPFVIVLLPLYYLLLQPGFLVIYFLSVMVLCTTLRRYECKRCVYFQCPVNCAEK